MALKFLLCVNFWDEQSHLVAKESSFLLGRFVSSDLIDGSDLKFDSKPGFFDNFLHSFGQILLDYVGFI